MSLVIVEAWRLSLYWSINSLGSKGRTYGEKDVPMGKGRTYGEKDVPMGKRETSARKCIFDLINLFSYILLGEQ